jgi:crotonobetainyl-CoA:carnitine CoA-transferase CaiB-like acyl-CoA transferase
VALWFRPLGEDKFTALATGIGRLDLVADPRFSDPAKQATNAAQLRAILDDVFSKQSMQHWRQVFEIYMNCGINSLTWILYRLSLLRAPRKIDFNANR